MPFGFRVRGPEKWWFCLSSKEWLCQHTPKQCCRPEKFAFGLDLPSENDPKLISRTRKTLILLKASFRKSISRDDQIIPPTRKVCISLRPSANSENRVVSIHPKTIDFTPSMFHGTAIKYNQILTHTNGTMHFASWSASTVSTHSHKGTAMKAARAWTTMHYLHERDTHSSPPSKRSKSGLNFNHAHGEFIRSHNQHTQIHNYMNLTQPTHPES